MQLRDYKTVLYKQEDGSWVAEVPAIAGCYALMPPESKRCKSSPACSRC